MSYFCKACLSGILIIFTAIDLCKLIEDNMSACNGVLRATANAIRELTLNRTCEVS